MCLREGLGGGSEVAGPRLPFGDHEDRTLGGGAQQFRLELRLKFASLESAIDGADHNDRICDRPKLARGAR